MLTLSKIKNSCYINRHHSTKITIPQNNTYELHKIIIQYRNKINSIRNHILAISPSEYSNEYQKQICDLQKLIIKHDEELLKTICNDDNLTKQIIDNINNTARNNIIFGGIIAITISFLLSY